MRIRASTKRSLTVRDLGALLGLVALTLGVGWLGSLVTMPAIPGWYAGLARPFFAPPNWVFGPVWTALYIMMAVAAWLVWRELRRGPRATALRLFALQLGLNLLWSFLFFGLQQMGWALLEIVALWLAIAATIAAFAEVTRPAAWLMLPYLAWVSFAVLLNASFWWLN